jgi:hypothetical protein
MCNAQLMDWLIDPLKSDWQTNTLGAAALSPSDLVTLGPCLDLCLVVRRQG